MDKTFAETQGQAPFDWNLFLANPPELGSEKHREASVLAFRWVSCAVGNQCAIIPRARWAKSSPSNGAPFDDKLNVLGRLFHSKVCDGNWPSARATLATIEARSAVLIQQELAKLNP